jgi:arylsulfatase A-like enzyme
MIEKFGDEYSVIIMADHGGHDRAHGSTMPEDMVIPLFFYGKDFPQGKVIEEDISLLEIAPTIAKLLGVSAEPEWEGKAMF